MSPQRARAAVKGGSARAARPRARRGGLVGLGCDVVEVSRMRREIERDGGGLRDEVFTPAEVAYCEGKRYPERHFAARFAAKEAFFKAMGTGANGWSQWREVEVSRGPEGEPGLVLHGRVRRLAARRSVRGVQVSLSHTACVAMAAVVLVS